MTRRTVVVLEVARDDAREWWEVMGLPEPWRWSEHFGEKAYVREAYCTEVERTVQGEAAA